jgi:hypothetical protein
MRAFFDSLSLGSGAFLIAVLSALFALGTARLRPAAIRWTMAALVPLALSYCCYWMPVWLGRPRDQDWSWEPIGVGFWWLAGLLASTVVTIIASRHATRNT